MQSHCREATVLKLQSRSDCFPILINMQSHSPEATVTPRRRGEAASNQYNGFEIETSKAHLLNYDVRSMWTICVDVDLDRMMSYVEKIFKYQQDYLESGILYLT